MVKRIIAIAIIFACASIGWVILGVTSTIRNETQKIKLYSEVGQLWGKTQRQHAPLISLSPINYTQYQWNSDYVSEKKNVFIDFDSSKIKVDINYQPRKKGLLWHSTYKVDFNGKYLIKNNSGSVNELYFLYFFPSKDGIYDAFKFSVNNKNIEDIRPQSGELNYHIKMAPEEEIEITLSYKTQGMDYWYYDFGRDVSQIKNFELIMTTNFDDINFPSQSMSPTEKNINDNGWEIIWTYENLFSGLNIGMEMPQKLSPSDFISRVSFFAPVSLFLFFFLIFIITTIKEINIHPMNYFFLAASFFSFHILLTYLIDHIDIHLACAISSIVSMGLVISYMRLVVGTRFALLETGLAQFVYLILFSYAFFLEGYTGLAITICCILTLFFVMQATAKIDWKKQFEVINK